ncbi:MAG: hypothetical protein KF841_16710 [Phycisphaerae bacterium]|nr:hypothetical protein [Phycisphaerae bacterium]
MFDPMTVINGLFATGSQFVGFILEVFFGPFILVVLGPLARIGEYFSTL